MGVCLSLFASPAAASQSPQEPPLVRATTRAVLIDVIVHDKHGKPVADLGRDDFELLDNGQERKITLFSANGDWPAAGGSGQAGAGPMTFSNSLVPSGAHVTVFLFDELNTRLADQQFAKKEFLHYLRSLPQNEHVAVFVLGDSLQLLHDFTQDSAALVAAVSRRPNRASPEAEVSNAAPTSSDSLTGDKSTSAQWDSFLTSSNKLYMDYAELVRATRTAEALETIAAHLQSVPGRKTLIWISGGFPIQLGLHSNADGATQSDLTSRSRNISGRGTGGGRQASGGGRGSQRAASSGGGGGSSNAASSSSQGSAIPGTGESFESDVARAIRALNEADVAVYPVDARGLMTAGPFQADRASTGKRMKSRMPVDFNYETLETLAEETGGRAFHQINELTSAIREADEDCRASYSLAFYAPSDQLDDSYHRLEVSIRRPGFSLRYRPGYVATSRAAVVPSLAEAITKPVAYAGIGFTAHLDRVDGGYKLKVTINPRDITLVQKDGKWAGSLQFLVMVGKVEQLTTIPLNLSESLFQQIQKQGLVFGARVKTPPGTTGFSLGFRDVPSGLVGTLHVPL